MHKPHSASTDAHIMHAQRLHKACSKLSQASWGESEHRFGSEWIGRCRKASDRTAKSQSDRIKSSNQSINQSFNRSNRSPEKQRTEKGTTAKEVRSCRATLSFDVANSWHKVRLLPSITLTCCINICFHVCISILICFHIVSLPLPACGPLLLLSPSAWPNLTPSPLVISSSLSVLA